MDLYSMLVTVEYPIFNMASNPIITQVYHMHHHET